jgi:DNA-binding NtrC family response regulator
METAAPKQTLLVVDDEEGPRRSVKIIFKDDFTVLMASEGQQALEFVRAQPVAIAILDILMPGISGVELLKRIKEISPRTEIIMLTAYETLETARQALRYGACDYLNKPFDVATLRTAVDRAAAKHRAAAASPRDLIPPAA